MMRTIAYRQPRDCLRDDYREPVIAAGLMNADARAGAVGRACVRGAGTLGASARPKLPHLDRGRGKDSRAPRPALRRVFCYLLGLVVVANLPG
jgi:hypothetical protein